jgi:hypothetical protein
MVILVENSDVLPSSWHLLYKKIDSGHGRLKNWNKQNVNSDE